MTAREATPLDVCEHYLVRYKRISDAVRESVTPVADAEFRRALTADVVSGLLGRMIDYEQALNNIARLDHAQAERSAAELARGVLVDHGTWGG